MAKKLSKKTWACKEGCKLDFAPCEHLEKLLPQLEEQLSYSRKVEYYNKAEAEKLEHQEFEKKAKEVQRMLLSFGLESFRVELIMDRFVSNLTLKEIASNRGYVDAKAVHRVITTTLDFLSRANVKAAKKLLRQYE